MSKVARDTKATRVHRFGQTRVLPVCARKKPLCRGREARGEAGGDPWRYPGTAKLLPGRDGRLAAALLPPEKTACCAAPCAAEKCRDFSRSDTATPKVYTFPERFRRFGSPEKRLLGKFFRQGLVSTQGNQIFVHHGKFFGVHLFKIQRLFTSVLPVRRIGVRFVTGRNENW